MAREYAPIRLNIWSDEDFRALSPRAQHLYFVVLTSPTLSHCGVADWRPKRIAAMAAGWMPAHVETAAAELANARYFVIDEDTEEVLVRSFIRHDGLMKQPNMAVAMCTAHMAVASPVIRATIVAEVRRLSVDQPELPCWGAKASKDPLARLMAQGRPEGFPTGQGNPSVNPSGNPSVNPSAEGSGKGSGKGQPKGSTNPSPTPRPTPDPSTLTLTTPSESPAAEPSGGPPPAPETEGQRVNRLTKTYTDTVQPSNFPAIAGVVRKAVRAAGPDGRPKYDDILIVEALTRMAAEGRAVTADSLRIEIDGHPPSRWSGRDGGPGSGPPKSTTSERVAQTQALKRPAPVPDQLAIAAGE